MKYTLLNRNKSTEAKDDIEFVSWMRRSDIQKWESNLEFMEGYAHRKITFEKIHLRFDSEENFVKDLIETKLLIVEEKKKYLGIFLK